MPASFGPTTIRAIETNVEKTNSLTSPYLGYVFIHTNQTVFQENQKWNPDTLQNENTGTESKIWRFLETHIYGYQHGRWVHTSATSKSDY